MKKFYFLFIIFFIQINSEFKINPIFLDEGKYPIVLSTTDENDYYLISDNASFKIEKITGKIVKRIKEFVYTSSNSIFITDNFNYNSLVNDTDKCYNIIYEPFVSSEVSSFPSLTFQSELKVKKIGGIAQKNDSIIYGYYQGNCFFPVNLNNLLISQILNLKLWINCLANI